MMSFLPGVLAALITSTIGIVISIILGWTNMSKQLAVYEERTKTLEKM